MSQDVPLHKWLTSVNTTTALCNLMPTNLFSSSIIHVKKKRLPGWFPILIAMDQTGTRRKNLVEFGAVCECRMNASLLIKRRTFSRSDSRRTSGADQIIKLPINTKRVLSINNVSHLFLASNKQDHLFIYLISHLFQSMEFQSP